MKALLFNLLFLLLPCLSFAQIQITEIMYDVPGTDTGREWIEIKNNSNDSIDFTQCKLFENETNHSVVPVSGDGIISAGNYAIISDTPTKFNIDNPSYNGLIFDSVFSLNNEGETLVIKCLDNVDDEISYTNSFGANGDGNTLHRDGNNFTVDVASPGSEGNNYNDTNYIQSNIINNSGTNTVTNSVIETRPNEQIEYYVYAKGPNLASVGSENIFTAKLVDTKKNIISNADFVWNFGDGSVGNGQRVSHIFNYSGNYIIYLTANIGSITVEDKISVKVVPVDISISNVIVGENGIVSILNKSSYELDISFWRLKLGNIFYSFPSHTIITPKNTLTISAKAINIPIQSDDISIMYQNGDLVSKYEKKVVESNKLNEVVSKKPSENISKTIKNIPNEGIGEELSIERENKLIMSTSSQIAGVIGSSNKDDDKIVINPVWKWIFGLLVVIILAIIGIFFGPKANIIADRDRAKAGSDFDIIEEI